MSSMKVDYTQSYYYHFKMLILAYFFEKDGV